MDDVRHYLDQWEISSKAKGRLSVLTEAYEILRYDPHLEDWRFEPGRKRGDAGYSNPMYCAFAATPFESDDWFVLRIVLDNDYDTSHGRFAVGFCPDFGHQDSARGTDRKYTKRRLDMKAELQTMKFRKIHTLKVPYPESGNRPHAYKGFEYKFPNPLSGEELAKVFLVTALEWEQIFRSLI